VARHRLVYDAVRDWMPHRVHALSIVARSPTEASV
jgi:stress-induced morphogen